MNVESYLEAYLTHFGWLQYNNIYDILVATRLAYLPIFFIVITNVTGPITSQESKNAVLVANRRMIIFFLFSIFVMSITLVPHLPLSFSIMEYTKPCPTAYGEAESVSMGSDRSTYSDVFSNVIQTEVKVPIWWKFFMGINAGFTRQAIAGIGCVTDIRGYQIRVEKQRIKDSAVATQLTQFVQYCFWPATARLQKEGLPTSELETDESDPQLTDIAWIGSPIFINTPGYYDTFQAGQGISGWAYSEGRDGAYYSPEGLGAMSSTEHVGRPYCNEWWAQLKELILAEVEPDLLTKVRVELPAGFGGLTPEQVDELVLKSVVSNSFAAASVSSAFTPSFNAEGSFSSFPARMLAGWGLDWAEIGLRPEMYAVRAAAPIIQAFILMGLYSLIGLAIVVSGLSFRAVLVITVALFSIKFWSYLWFATWWLENNLFLAMFPEGEGYAMGFLALLVGQSYIVGGDFAIKVNVIEFVTMFMYLFFPVLYAILMSSVSVLAVANYTTLVSSLAAPVKAGAGQAVEYIKDISKGGVGKIFK